MNTSTNRRSSKASRLGAPEDFDNHASAGWAICGTFFRMRNYANPSARLAFWRADVVEESRLHAGCRPDIGAWHRREHGDFQRRQRAAFSTIAFSRPGTIGLDRQYRDDWWPLLGNDTRGQL